MRFDLAQGSHQAKRITHLNMQWYNNAMKNLQANISSNLESLNFQTCNDTKL